MGRFALDLSTGFQLGDFQVIPDRNTVKCAKQSIHLEPKIMDVCLMLATRCGDVVLRDEMIDEVWGAKFGSDEGVTRAIHVLRKTFTQPESDGVVIETIPKRGYRLVAAIADLPNKQHDPNMPPASAGKSDIILAVLPFDNLSSDEEMTFFSDGVSEEILGRIVRGSDITVIGRTSSFQYRGADKAKAYRVLGATHILDGSIRRSGDKIRISAHLLETDTQAGIWSDQYDRNIADIFAVQDEISEAIASAMDKTFSAKPVQAIAPAIYDRYLRARADGSDVKSDDMQRTLMMLESVTHDAPDFAPGWAALGEALVILLLSRPHDDRDLIRKRAQDAIARCLALDPGSTQTILWQWYLLPPFGQFLEQQRLMDRLANSSGLSGAARFLLSFHLQQVGRTSEALRVGEESSTLLPGDIDIDLILAITTWYAGNFERGRMLMESMLERSPDNHHIAHFLILACVHDQDWDAANQLISPDRLAQHPLREYILTTHLVRRMQYRNSDDIWAAFNKLAQPAKLTGHVDAAWLEYSAHLGLVDPVYDLIDQVKLGPAGASEDHIGFSAYRTGGMFAAATPEMRNDTRFVKLCARYGLVEYWLELQKWPDCADQVPYDFRAECEKYRDYPKDEYFA
ncbi:winged helix-turn-helix domain-containing protein [Parasphingorhabdus sp.]|uniref:winged helix-turn-helix domain-containing protein n=1 Tax=Parasphingorhabdus sp. TaxID=2709688 RepID=UPI003BB0F693